MKFLKLTRQLIIFSWAGIWAQFKAMKGWDGNIKRRSKLGGSTHWCWGQKNQTVVLVYLSRRNVFTTFHFSELLVGVIEPQDPLHSHTCLSQGWLLPASQWASVYWGLFSDWQDYRNSHIPHGWSVPSLLLNPQTWLSLTDTGPIADFLGGKMLWTWHRGEMGGDGRTGRDGESKQSHGDGRGQE